jgi:hypothetical protein
MRRVFLLGLVMTMAQLAAARRAYACKSDTECKGDRVCEAGRCVSPKVGPTRCNGDKDCAGNDVCEQKVCVSPNSVSPSAAPGTIAMAPAPASAAPPTPQPAAAAPATPSPEPATVSPTPATAGPATVSPAATTTAAPAKGPGAPAAATPALPTTFKSIGVLVPEADDFFGVSAHVDYRVESWSSNEWAATVGFAYEGLFYTGDLDMTVFMNTAGVTLGVRPAVSKTISFALRGGAIVTATKTEITGVSSNNDFSAALLAGGDLMLGYLMIGAEGWIREGSTWLLRGGFAW